VNSRDDDSFVRPGRISDKGRGATKPKSFVGQVMRAAKKVGHTGTGFGRQGRSTGSRFGRGAFPRRLPCRFARRRAGW
jgi:hypothetical protein